MHLPTSKLSLVLGQVKALDVRLRVHHDVLCVRAKLLKHRILTESFEICLFVAHLVQVVHRSHIVNLNVTCIAELCTRAARVFKHAAALGISFKFIFKLKFVVLLLMIAEAMFGRHLALT